MFTVIIPTYERPDSLSDCLRGLTQLDSPRERFEVIVVDDGGVASLDTVIEPFRSIMDVRLIARPHQGGGAARNAGAAAARGRYLAFTADDCVPEVNWLQAFEDRYDQDPDGAALGGSIRNGCQGDRFAEASQMLVEALCFGGADGRAGHLYFTPNNLVVSVDRFRSMGGFDPAYSLSTGEDRDFCARWEAAGFGLAYCPQAAVVHYHPLSLVEFLKMHWRYGRGSGQFHVKRAERSAGRLRFQSPRYYLGLVLYPVRKYGVKAVMATLLVLTAQAASAAGVIAEWLWCRRK